MFGSTMLLTVGQALDRAQREGTVVRLSVAGEWVSGRVLNTDSQGVVLAEQDGDLCVLRMDAIACVRLPAGFDPADRRRPIPMQQVPDKD